MDEIINEVYKMLKDRQIHPRGSFDKHGRFFLENSDLVNVREPSRSHPYSQMSAGRTKKYVKAVAAKYSPKNKHELIYLV
jgi:hypothetical protein